MLSGFLFLLTSLCLPRSPPFQLFQSSTILSFLFQFSPLPYFVVFRVWLPFSYSLCSLCSHINQNQLLFLSRFDWNCDTILVTLIQIFLLQTESDIYVIYFIYWISYVSARNFEYYKNVIIIVIIIIAQPSHFKVVLNFFSKSLKASPLRFSFFPLKTQLTVWCTHSRTAANTFHDFHSIFSTLIAVIFKHSTARIEVWNEN